MQNGDNFRGYILAERKGGGNFGEVWLAEKDEKPYALKFLFNKNKDTGFDKTKFDKELETLKKAKGHPNILTIHEAFTEHGNYILVTDYAEGGSLKNKQFASDKLLQIITQVFEGVNHLHKLNIIHRDIKSDNILLKNGVPCLCDFGLARDLSKTQSTTQVGGTMLYFSPELASRTITGDKKYRRDLLDDLWSTAVTFYETLTGDFPFTGLGKTANVEREPLPNDFPLDLIPFFDKAFQKEKTDRFQSAAEMLDALKAIEQKRIELEKERIEQERLRIVREQLEVEYRQKYIEIKDEYQQKHKEEISFLRDKYNQEISILRGMNQTLSEEAANLRKKIKARDKEIENQSEQITRLSSPSYFEEEKKKLQQSYDVKETELLKEKRNLTKKVSTLETQATAVNEELAKTKRMIRDLENGYVEKEKELEGLKNILKTRNSQISEKDEEVTSLEREILTLKSSINNKDVEISKLKNSKPIRFIEELPKKQQEKKLSILLPIFGGISLILVVCYGVYFLVNKNIETANTNRAVNANQLAKDKDAEIAKYKNEASSYVKEKKFQEAIDKYREAIKKYPNNADFYTNLGDIYRYQNKENLDQNEAIGLYSTVINTIDANNRDALFGLGYSYNELGNKESNEKEKQKLYDKAIAYYERCIEMGGWGELNLGRIYVYGKKDYKNAKEWYDKTPDTETLKPENLVYFYSNSENTEYKNLDSAKKYYQDFLKKENEYKEKGYDFETQKKNLEQRINNMQSTANTNINTNSNWNSNRTIQSFSCAEYPILCDSNNFKTPSKLGKSR